MNLLINLALTRVNISVQDLPAAYLFAFRGMHIIRLSMGKSAYRMHYANCPLASCIRAIVMP